MTQQGADEGEVLAAALADGWGAVERILNANLSKIRGITYSEYRLLSAIAAGPVAGSSRVDLARSVGLSASAVTRALRPLADLGMVGTTKHPRDARLAVASLTEAGTELVSDATGVVRDVMVDITERTPLVNRQGADLLAMLGELARS